MKIIESVEAVPGRVEAVVRVLRAQPLAMLPRAVLVDLLQPTTLRSANSMPTLATESVGAAEELGLIEEFEAGDGEKMVRLTSPVTKVCRTVSDVAVQLPRLLAQSVFNIGEGGGANRFALVTAWLLLLDPSAIPNGQTALKTLLEEQGFNLDELGLRNDARWDMVLYWTTYLGLTYQVKDSKCTGIIGDPSTYLVRHLDLLVPKGSQVSVEAFRDNVGQLCPVLDGGSVNREITGALQERGVWQGGLNDRLSGALSLGLRVLKSRGELEYWCPNDQRTFLLLAGDERIAFLKR